MTDDKRTQILDATAIMMRSVSPHFFRNGEILEEAFRVSPERDGTRLSVSQESKIAPEDLISEIAARRKCPAGLARLAVDEIVSVPLSDSVQPELGDEPALSVWDDSMNDSVPDHHAHIDHKLVMENDDLRKTVRKMLANRANENGQFYKA